jgi:K(+)-stimulated pyrophosphate-energized sodium pump
MIESRADAKAVVKKEYGIEPNFELAKHFLESADGAGNTFKATAKPVLIGTAVVGATTMVFGIIILLERLFGNVIAKLSLVQPEVILGLLMGGAVIYWFTGASIQAVTTGSYQAVVFIKKNINLDKKEASIEDSKKVVQICTQYAQKGMINIFIVIFFMCLALAFFNPYFFIGYLIGIAFFGLYQAIFMANAGGCWDNGKKIVEVDLKMKNTPLHEASVVGDTVGDPFKDTSSVSLNPVIKFTTLFGLLATEIAVTMTNTNLKYGLATAFFIIALIFVYRSFYSMRISADKLGE